MGLPPSTKAIGHLLLLASLALSSPLSAKDRPAAASGRVTIKQVNLAFIASGALGGGTLTYKGKSYPFKIGGLGVGGIGASQLSASGEVYGLDSTSDFPGMYAEVRTGWALGDKGKGRVWLQNAKGVMLRLKGQRQGLQLATGAEGVLIRMD